MATGDLPTRRLTLPVKTSQTEQYVLNLSFDELHQLLMVGLLAYNPTAIDPVTGLAGRYDRVQINDATGGLTLSEVGTSNQATGQVTITTSATQIVAARTSRRGVVIVNLGGSPVYLGGGSVATTTGLFLSGNEGASIYIPTTAAISGIVASGSQSVSYMEVY